MKKYRELTPEERWEITDNLTPQDIMNGEVDHYLNDNVFWREVDYEHPDLVSFLDNRYAIINKEYGLEKLHKLSKQYPRKKWEQIIAWYNHENNKNTNENKNMKQNKIKITENELKQIVAESVRKILSEARKPSDKTVGKHTLKGLRYDKNGNPLYTSDTMSDDEKKNQGWKFSKKHGMYGQLSDPTKLSESSTDINEAISTDYRKSLKQLLTKSFGNLDDNEKQFLYDLLNNEPWETIYIALGILESNRINESRKKREPRKGTIELNGKHIDAVEDGLDKYGNPMYKVNDPSIKGRRCKDGSIRVQHYNFKPNRVNESKHYSYPCLQNLNTKVVEYVKTKHPNEILPYDGDDDDRYYVEALLNLGFKRDGYDRDGSEVFSNGKLRVILSIDSINNVLIVSPANGYTSTLGL